MSNDDFNPLRKLGRVVFTVLVIAFCLWLAVQLLSQIWIALVIFAAAAVLVSIGVLWLRRRRDRW